MIFEQEPIIPDLISKRSLPREMGRRSKMEPKNFVEKGEAKEYFIKEIVKLKKFFFSCYFPKNIFEKKICICLAKEYNRKKCL